MKPSKTIQRGPVLVEKCITLRTNGNTESLFGLSPDRTRHGFRLGLGRGYNDSGPCFRLHVDYEPEKRGCPTHKIQIDFTIQSLWEYRVMRNHEELPPLSSATDFSYLQKRFDSLKRLKIGYSPNDLHITGLDEAFQLPLTPLQRDTLNNLKQLVCIDSFTYYRKRVYQKRNTSSREKTVFWRFDQHKHLGEQLLRAREAGDGEEMSLCPTGKRTLVLTPATKRLGRPRDRCSCSPRAKHILEVEQAQAHV